MTATILLVVLDRYSRDTRVLTALDLRPASPSARWPPPVALGGAVSMASHRSMPFSQLAFHMPVPRG